MFWNTVLGNGSLIDTAWSVLPEQHCLMHSLELFTLQLVKRWSNGAYRQQCGKWLEEVIIVWKKTSIPQLLGIRGVDTPFIAIHDTLGGDAAGRPVRSFIMRVDIFLLLRPRRRQVVFSPHSVSRTFGNPRNRKNFLALKAVKCSLDGTQQDGRENFNIGWIALDGWVRKNKATLVQLNNRFLCMWSIFESVREAIQLKRHFGI